MAVTDQQKLDFLLKKIGYTKTKTGNVSGTGDPGNGTPKQPFAEAIPSPLVVANSSLWNEADSIPATPPGSDTVQVKVYLTTSALRLTEDVTSSGARSWIAYTTYNNTSSTRLTNWIDTQFGAGYLIKVYKGDPNASGVPLSAGATNNNWFFDYSAGVLNFNDSSVPVTSSDSVYIVGYRYIGQTGAPTSGISTFSYLDLTVERNLDVGVQGGISTFRNNIDANGIIEGIAGENKIPFLYSNLAALPNAGTYHGMFAHVHSEGRGYFAHAGNWLELVNKDTSGNVGLSGDLDVDGHTNLDNISVAGVSTFTGDATFSGNVSIGGTLTYEDVTNVDSVGLLTARSGIRVTGGVIEALAAENKIPSLYANMAALPDPGTYHGMFAHVHSTGRGYFAHGGAWYELVNADLTGRVGTGTESYFIDRLVSTSTTATSLNVTGVTTAVTVDINGDLDVDGHTNLDNISVAGVSTFAGDIVIPDSIVHSGDTDTKIRFPQDNNITLETSGSQRLRVDSLGRIGISQPSPQYKLDILETTNTRALFIKYGNSTNTTSGVEIQNSSAAGKLFLGVWGPSAGAYGQVNANDAFIGSSEDWSIHSVSNTGVIKFGIGSGGPVEKMRITSTGVDISRDLDVDGHTNLDNVSIAGVTTHNEDVWFKGATSGRDAYWDKSENSLRFTDNALIKLGNHANGDAQISHDGTKTYINAPTAPFVLYTPNLEVRNSATNAINLKVDTSGAVGLYYGTPTSNKLETTSSGINVTGTIDTDGLVVSGVSTFTGAIDANGDLDVDGHTNLDNVSIAGVTTFAANARFDSTITAGGATGNNGQYLKTTGSGVAWATFPALRTRDTQTASAGQTSFPFNYNVGFVDVFINGVKLTDSEFTATNGTHVVLAVGSFVGDIVELVSYNTVSAGGGASGIGNVVEDTTPQLGGNLDLFGKTINGTGGINITGVITATTFIGDGSGLTGIVASGAGGVVIKDSGSVVGTAGTIDFGDNLTVSPINAGIVTITGTVGVDTSQFNVNKLDVSGISTFKSNIDVNADLDVDGHTNLDNVSIAGVTTMSSTLNVSGVKINTDSDPSPTRLLNIAHASSSSPLVRIYNNHANGRKAQIEYKNTQSTFTQGISQGSPHGFQTFSINPRPISFWNSSLERLRVESSGNISIFYDLDVDGHTNLDNVTIAGVVTATTFKGALEATSASFSSNVNVGTGVTINPNGQATFSGITTFGNQINGTVLNLSSNITASGSISAVGANLDNQIIINGTQPKILFVDSNANPDYELRVDGGVFQIIDSTAPATRFKIVGNDAVVGTGITLNGGDGHATYTGIVTALKFVGDGSGLTNISSSGINTTNVRSDTLVVGENTTGISTFHRVQIPTNKTLFFGNNLDASISYPTSGYMYLYGGTAGDMVIQTGGNRAIKMEASGNFEIDTGSNEIAIKATKNGPVELYQNGYGTPEGLRFATTGVGVTVIGITSMTDNLMVGTGATITPAGAVQFAGIVTASSFIGDGSGLTGITASGSGVIVKNNGSTVGTAGTINFANGLDVTPISAGIVTVSTATTSITSGNSKVFVNDQSTSNNNGSFEVFLSDVTSSGAAHTAFRLYSPAANSNAAEFFHNNTQIYSSLALKANYGGNTNQQIIFRTNNSNFTGVIAHSTAAGQFNFYNTYNGTQYNPLVVGTTVIFTKANVSPLTNNTYDLGNSSAKYRQFHATGVNAGVVTATDVHVGAGVSAVGIVTADQGLRVNADSPNPAPASATNYISVGDSQDLKVYHNGGTNYIAAADGDIQIKADNIMLVSDDTAGRSLYQDNANSRLELGFDGTAAAYVSSSNVQFAKPITASTDSQHDIGTNSVRFRNAYVDTYYGDGSNLTGISAAAPTTSDIQVVYEITNQTSFSYFRFAGNGVDSSANNPDIYLERGQKYRFINNSGGSHPFQIQTTASSAYTTGVTYPSGNSATSGNIDFAVRWDAPSQLKYVCTSHGAMVGNIYISGGDAGRRTTANAATASIANNAAGNITIVAAKTYALLKIQTSAAAWVTLYTDSTSRSNDSSRNETTDPTPGSGVIAEVITTGASTQIMTPGIIGWNNDGTVSSNVYAKVVNKSGSTGAITVTLHYLEMEI